MKTEQDPVHMTASVVVILGDGETVPSSQSGFLCVLPVLVKQQLQQRALESSNYFIKILAL